MKLAYFDCFSGISGDMTLGALVHAGVPLEHLRDQLNWLDVPGWQLRAEKVWKNGMAATYVCVTTQETHTHRSLSTIEGILQKAKLANTVREHAIAIFRKLGEAEAAVHDVPIGRIHFHEVGAVDAIVDIVGACIGLHFLAVDRFACSPLNVGGGTARMAHGVLPVPAPATARLLLGKPTYSNGVQKELVTPTGAAIVAALCDSFGPQPLMIVSAIGYGAGSADLEGQPNVLRLMVGESVQTREGNYTEEIRVLEANLDDLNPQIIGYFVERALDAGALDVFTTTVQMKKNRPGTLLTLLCQSADEAKFQELFFAETSTLGVRSHTTQRRTLPREWQNVSTPYGEVRMKIARVNGQVIQVSPEYEDCRKLAGEKAVPLRRVMQEAMHAWRQKQK